jgi:hypothetical protein
MAASEPIIRAEKVRSRHHQGWLELTASHLVFRPIRPSGAKAAILLSLERIEGARAKKAFAAGSEELEVVYRDPNDKRQTVRFERGSWSAWASDTLGNGTGRAEPNSFAAFERDIASVRLTAINPTAAAAPPSSADRIQLLARLGDLRSSGVLTDEEFQAQKARVLGS